MATILVADDDSSIRAVLRHILEANDHRVWEVSDGDRAAHTAIMQSFDLIMMDLVMRRQSGTQAAREILLQKPAQKMIFMSGIVTLAVKEFREMARNLGVHVFLQKPFDSRSVVEAVDRALAERAE